MTVILIIESDTPSLIQNSKNHGLLASAQIYSRALRYFDTELEIRVATPYQRVLKEEDYIGISGAVFTGSAVSWTTSEPEAAPLRKAMSTLFELECPVLGSCNGMQLAAVVLGGKTGASPNGFEVGLAQDICLTEAGEIHPMMAGRDKVYSAPSIHRDEVRVLPQHAVLMAYNNHSPVQAFTYEHGGVNFWGTQYHPELCARHLSDILQKGSGIFKQCHGLVKELLLAETDQAVAFKLGSSVAALSAETRMLEIHNWLRHLKGRVSN